MSEGQRRALDSMLRAGRNHVPKSLAGLREWTERSLSVMPQDPEVSRDDLMIGEIPAAWFGPPDPLPHAAVLYLHGGAYIMGSIDSHAGLTSSLARRSSVACLSLDYRLAPEHRFPAQLEDALAAYHWMMDTHNIPASRIVLAGDSAGGGLVLSTLCAVRDAGLPLPAAAVCISPWVDLEGLGDSAVTKVEADPMLRIGDLAPFRRLFLGNAHPRDPRAAPLYADLTGLPPLLIQVGENEILLDDATRIATRAREAGVDVTIEVWPGMVHVWHLFAPILDEGQEAINGIAEFVQGRIER
jgi:acetyl esterase/lipase